MTAKKIASAPSIPNEGIEIVIQYKGNKMILPINPEHIKVSRASNSHVAEVIGLGQVSIPREPELATIEINSFFWGQLLQSNRDGRYTYRTSKEYADWFKIWQRSKLPARWTVTKLKYDLWVLYEHFNYDVNAGEEDDTYYELLLKEYRPYGAKKVEYQIPPVPTEPILIEPAVPPRVDNKPPTPATYTPQPGDTIATILEKFGPVAAGMGPLSPENVEALKNGEIGFGALPSERKTAIQALLDVNETLRVDPTSLKGVPNVNIPEKWRGGGGFATEKEMLSQ